MRYDYLKLRYNKKEGKCCFVHKKPDPLLTICLEKKIYKDDLEFLDELGLKGYKMIQRIDEAWVKYYYLVREC